jgi:cytoskeletal protein CcmA (bactofilin family)
VKSRGRVVSPPDIVVSRRGFMAVFKRRKPDETATPPPTPRGHVIASGLAESADARAQQRDMASAATRPNADADTALTIPAVPKTMEPQASPADAMPPQPKEPPSMSIQPRQPTPTPTTPVTPPTGAALGPMRTTMAPPRMPQSPSDRRTLVVGRGISVQGSIADAERLVVEGTVDAKSLNATELQIAPGGVFKGQVEVEDAEISGLIDGMLTVRGSLVVRSTGQLNGEVRCRRLQVEDGGQISGKIGMITDGSPAASAQTPAVEANVNAE